MGRRIVIILLIVLIPVVIGVAVFVGYRLGWFRSSVAAAPKEYAYSVGEFLVNLDEPGYKRYVKATVFIASDNKNIEGELAEKMPKVRDAIIGILRSKKIDDLNTTVKTDAVKREIKDKLNMIFVSGKLTDVYLNDIIIQ